MKRQAEWVIEPGFCIYLAGMLLHLPLKWLLGALAAGLIHELGHIGAVKLCKLPVHSVHLEAAGVRIHTGAATEGQELLCAAAGPAAGFLASFAFPFFPQMALCAFVQAVFNLLPLMPFDGGRILRCSAGMLLGQDRGGKVLCAVEYITCGILALLALWAARLSWIFPAACVLIILRCVRKEKNTD